MLPVLLDLKFIKIYTMGVFLVLAFFWGSFILWRLIRLSSFKEEDVFDGLFYSLFGGLFFGRLIYVIINFKEFGFDILKFLLINGYPGLSLYGMLTGAFVALYFWSQIRKIRFKEIIDYFIPALFLALAIGKLGSFFSGAEVGSKTNLIVSIKYANLAGMRHLTPLYESILFFIGMSIVYRILFEIRKEKLVKGFNLLVFLWLQGFVYFIFDNMKEYRLYFFGLSFNKIVSFVLLLTFSFYFVYYFRSLINGKLVQFINSTKTYVKSSFKIIFNKAKKEDRRRGKKPTTSD